MSSFCLFQNVWPKSMVLLLMLFLTDLGVSRLLFWGVGEGFDSTHLRTVSLLKSARFDIFIQPGICQLSLESLFRSGHRALHFDMSLSLHGVMSLRVGALKWPQIAFFPVLTALPSIAV